jgi:DNA-binding GntR family transcriptional regulator
VAAVLLGLPEESGTLPTRHELAAMVGSVREVATRALGDLERSGAIRLGPGRRVVIQDRRTLQRLSRSAPPHGA